MKALVLWQPWATLMQIGIKKNETRGRPWLYRGDVAICAAAHALGGDVPDDWIPALRRLWEFRALIPDVGEVVDVRELYYALPRRVVVCVVRKTGCLDVSLAPPVLTDIERDCGNYRVSPGHPRRFYYPTDQLRPVLPTVPVFGRQGPFELSPDEEAKVLARLRLRA